MESLLIRSQTPLPIASASCTYLGKICDKLVPQSHFLLAISPCLRLPHQAVSIISPPGHLRLSSAAGATGQRELPCLSGQREPTAPEKSAALSYSSRGTGGLLPYPSQTGLRKSSFVVGSPGQDVEASCAWNEASLPTTSKIRISFLMQGKGQSQNKRCH